MKRKKTFFLMLVLIALVSCFRLSAVAAGADLSDGNFLEVRATGKFDMEVPANSAVKADSSFPLEVGEVVTIKATYSPFSASVDFGLVAPDGLFYGLNTTTGSFDKAIKVSQRGHYYFVVRNNSSEIIHVSGHVNY
ncbi:hypothetical protein [Clostridium phoceensis]|uniref:hypothetical protein n=1 Tax=Clostridium phoceensis TaxID=1650661 RepID=UPI0011C9FC0D|nr:hypothetical protein [Clostridium phoceensis]